MIKTNATRVNKKRCRYSDHELHLINKQQRSDDGEASSKHETNADIDSALSEARFGSLNYVKQQRVREQSYNSRHQIHSPFGERILFSILDKLIMLLF
jgi:hypothetical protein